MIFISVIHHVTNGSKILNVTLLMQIQVYSCLAFIFWLHCLGNSISSLLL